MNSSWPVGVTTLDDMRCDAKTLFGNCQIENLLTGMPFDGYSGCFLIRVKGACNQGNWKKWPDLIDEAMKATVETYGRPDIIQVKSRVSGAPRARLYDTLQVTPNACTCRVYFGSDKHHKHQTSSSATKATKTMDNMLMANFKPTTEQWDEHQPGYHAKAFSPHPEQVSPTWRHQSQSGPLIDL